MGTVVAKLSHILPDDAALRAGSAPQYDQPAQTKLVIRKPRFTGHRVFTEESPTYLGLQTMYHLYTVELECSGLPEDDFTTSFTEHSGSMLTLGWRWTVWQEVLDTVHERARQL